MASRANRSLTTFQDAGSRRAEDSGSIDNLGYVIWVKIPYRCLERPDLETVLSGSVRGGGETAREIRSAAAKVLWTIAALERRGIKLVRIGLSWCEWDAPSGPAWIEWYMRSFAEKFDLLPSITFVPPSISESGACNAPPRRLAACAEFVRELILAIGATFSEVELFNEWNLDTDWHPGFDPGYEKFSVMAAAAAITARHFGKRTVLGGPTVSWPRESCESTLALLRIQAERGLFSHFDAAGFHNLRGTWSDHVAPPALSEIASLVRRAVMIGPARGWWLEERLHSLAHEADGGLRGILLEGIGGRQSDTEIWLTEYGFPVADPECRFDMGRLEKIQATVFAHMSESCVSKGVARAYWYSLRDQISPSVRFLTTGWEDELQYHYGDSDVRGNPRLLGRLLESGGAMNVMGRMRGPGAKKLLKEASLKRTLPSGYRSNKAAKT